MHIAFDLDGTLIDSAPSIIRSLEFAFETLRLEPARKPERAMIGPPLVELVRTICPHEPAETHAKIVEAFAQRYDSHEVLNFTVFPGAEELMALALAVGCQLHLITNKRRIPVDRILANAGWEGTFTTVYTPESLGAEVHPTKAKLLARFLTTQKIDPGQCVYVGDREDDKFAAEENGTKCILVSW